MPLYYAGLASVEHGHPDDGLKLLQCAQVAAWGIPADDQRGIVLATVHVKAGEPRGLRLAHDAITNVTKLSSVRARRRLEPLAAALEAQPRSDARELARMARQVAA